MTDFALLGVWSRMDDGDEVRYTFRGNGTMTFSAIGLETTLAYRVENGVLAVENAEPGEPERRLVYRIYNNTLSVWAEGAAVPTVMKRAVLS